MSVAVSYIQLFQLLKAKIGEQEAESLVEFVDAKVKEGIKEANDQNLKVLATREDFVNIKQEITNMRHDVKQEMALQKVEIANSKAEMIKWMFLFWIGQLAAFIAIAKFFLSK